MVALYWIPPFPVSDLLYAEEDCQDGEQVKIRAMHILEAERTRNRRNIRDQGHDQMKQEEYCLFPGLHLALRDYFRDYTSSIRFLK